MVEYDIYNGARTALFGLITNKESEIKDLEKEIVNLKITRRLLDDEFNKKMIETPKYLG